MNQLNDTLFREMVKAIEAIKRGEIIILYDARKGATKGELAFAGCFSTPEKTNFCIREGGGLVCLAMKEAVANRIGVKKQPSNNHESFQPPFATPISLAANKVDFSAHARSATILKACEPTSDETDFIYPGHVPTLIAHKKGIEGRKGLTEGVLELIHLAGVDSPGVLCEILNSHGNTANFSELKHLAKKFKLPLICKSWLINYLEELSV